MRRATCLESLEPGSTAASKDGRDGEMMRMIIVIVVLMMTVMMTTMAMVMLTVVTIRIGSGGDDGDANDHGNGDGDDDDDDLNHDDDDDDAFDDDDDGAERLSGRRRGFPSQAERVSNPIFVGRRGYHPVLNIYYYIITVWDPLRLQTPLLLCCTQHPSLGL